MKRDTVNNYDGNRVRVVSQSYKENPCNTVTRYNNVLEERNPIDKMVALSLKGNPYVNNMTYKSTYDYDVINDCTNISSREYN